MEKWCQNEQIAVMVYIAYHDKFCICSYLDISVQFTLHIWFLLIFFDIQHLQNVDKMKVLKV